MSIITAVLLHLWNKSSKIFKFCILHEIFRHVWENCRSSTLESCKAGPIWLQWIDMNQNWTRSTFSCKSPRVSVRCILQWNAPCNERVICDFQKYYCTGDYTRLVCCRPQSIVTLQQREKDIRVRHYDTWVFWRHRTWVLTLGGLESRWGWMWTAVNGTKRGRNGEGEGT